MTLCLLPRWKKEGKGWKRAVWTRRGERRRKKKKKKEEEPVKKDRKRENDRKRRRKKKKKRFMSCLYYSFFFLDVVHVFLRHFMFFFSFSIPFSVMDAFRVFF